MQNGHFTLNLKNLWNRNNGAFALNPDVKSALANPYHLDQNAIGEMMDNSLNTSLCDPAYRCKNGFQFPDCLPVELPVLCKPD